VPRAVDRRAQLIEAGAELFNARPYDEISIDEIAASAGISKGLLYHYFAGKRGLYVEVVRAESDRLREVTDAAGEDPIRAGLDAFLDYVAGRAQAWSALMRGGIGSDVEVAEIVEGTRAELVERVIARHWTGRAAAPPALRAAVRGWQGFVEAATLDWIERGDLDRAALRELLALALDGAVEASRAVTGGESRPAAGGGGLMRGRRQSPPQGPSSPG
jgi:AcrR family transcriptional regulator